MEKAKVFGEPNYVLFCEECSRNKTMIELMVFAHGLLSRLQEIGIEVQAKTHEEATGHHTVLFYPDIRQ